MGGGIFTAGLLASGVLSTGVSIATGGATLGELCCNISGGCCDKGTLEGVGTRVGEVEPTELEANGAGLLTCGEAIALGTAAGAEGAEGAIGAAGALTVSCEAGI